MIHRAVQLGHIKSIYVQESFRCGFQFRDYDGILTTRTTTRGKLLPHRRHDVPQPESTIDNIINNNHAAAVTSTKIAEKLSLSV